MDPDHLVAVKDVNSDPSHRRAKFCGFSFETETEESICKISYGVFYDLFLLITLLIPNVWFFSNPHQPILLLSGHQLAVLQFSFDANYSIFSDSTALRAQPSFQMLVESIRSPGHPYCDQLGYKVKDWHKTPPSDLLE